MNDAGHARGRLAVGLLKVGLLKVVAYPFERQLGSSPPYVPVLKFAVVVAAASALRQL